MDSSSNTDNAVRQPSAREKARTDDPLAKLRFIGELARDKRLTAGALSVGVHLTDWSDFVDCNPATPGIRALATATGHSQTTVVAAVALLEERGWFAIAKGNRAESSTYMPNWTKAEALRVARIAENEKKRAETARARKSKAGNNVVVAFTPRSQVLQKLEHGAPDVEAHGAPDVEAHGAPDVEARGAQKVGAHGAPAAGAYSSGRYSSSDNSSEKDSSPLTPKGEWGSRFSSNRPVRSTDADSAVLTRKVYGSSLPANFKPQDKTRREAISLFGGDEARLDAFRAEFLGRYKSGDGQKEKVLDWDGRFLDEVLVATGRSARPDIWPENGFDMIWADYPKLSGKWTAEKSFAELREGGGIRFEELSRAVKFFASNEKEKKTEERYIPGFSKWVANGGFVDAHDGAVKQASQPRQSAWMTRRRYAI